MEEAATTAQITVRYCNPKKEGRTNATIKTDDGQMYFVSPEMYPQFEEGGRYNIQYKTNNFKGVQYRHVEKVAKIATATPAAQTAHNAMTKATYGKVDMETAERIFVCGAINALCGNQNIDPRGLTVTDMTAEVNKLRAVWRTTFGNPQKDEELDDAIPYA